MNNTVASANTNRHRVTLLGHRGTSLMAPENTRPAFEFACRHQADVLEIDVRLSRDRELMVFHDARLDRTTNGSGLVADHSSAAVQRLDAGYRFRLAGSNDYSFRGRSVQVMSLADLFREFPDMRVNIDLKDKTTEAVTQLAREVEACGAADRVVAASFHHAVIEDCRQRFPWLTTSASKTDVQWFYWHYLRGRHTEHALPARIFQLPVRFWLISLGNRKIIDAVHEADSRVDFWTVNKPEIMSQLIANGADGIVTDRADLAAPIIRDTTDRP